MSIAPLPSRLPVRNNMTNDLKELYSTLTLPALMTRAKQHVLEQQLKPAHFYFELAIETSSSSGGQKNINNIQTETNDLTVDKVTLLVYSNIVESALGPNDSVSHENAALLGDAQFWIVSKVSETAPQTSTYNLGVREPFLCFERFLKNSPRYNYRNARNNLLFYNDVLQLEELCVPGREEDYVEKYLQIYSTYFASANGDKDSYPDGSGAISPIDLPVSCRRQIVEYHAQLEESIL